jgi:hypothetical protein
MTNALDVINEKVVRDGKVAVLVSPGFGAGWYTWNLDHPELVFDPIIVDMVLNEVDYHEIEFYVNEKYGEDEVYTGGISDLVVVWVPVGARFRIEEYDGSESLKLESKEEWITA